MAVTGKVIHNPNATPESEREKYLKVLRIFEDHYRKENENEKAKAKKGE